MVGSDEEDMPEIQGRPAGHGDQPGMFNILQYANFSPEDFLKTLPLVVQRRVKALEKLNDSHKQLEGELRDELHKLEVKYDALYAPLFAKRADVVNGTFEPTDEDAGVSLEELKKSYLEETAKKLSVTDVDDAEKKPNPSAAEPDSGVPDFWLTALQNHQALAETITEKDEEVLKYLKDIRSSPLPDNQKGFKLEFEFRANPFFTNTLLQKSYHMIENNDLILDHAAGTEIDWKPGKNVTVKVVKKKQKSKGRKPDRVVSKTLAADSFFNFFSPPKMPEEEVDAEEEEKLQEALESDYELGTQLRDHIVPHAVLWYSGEALEDDYDEDEDEQGAEDDEDDDEDAEDDDDEEEDDDEDNEDEPKPKLKKGGKAHHAGPAPKTRGGAAPAGAQPECKQQ